LRSLTGKEKTIWVISFDGDYFTKTKSGAWLNPLLYKEIRDRCPDSEIRFFDSIVDGLDDAVRGMGIKPPDAKSVEGMKEEEKQSQAIKETDWRHLTLREAIPIRDVAEQRRIHLFNEGKANTLEYVEAEAEWLKWHSICERLGTRGPAGT